ncbi:MAG: OmpA family protein [Bacteroidetes bacterium]|nr:OmpA family protein [Bacteroidota bacterium]
MKKNRFSKTVLFLLLSLPILLNAQKKWEMGVLLGGSGYLGDLSQPSHISLDFNEVHPSFNFFIRHHLTSKWALRGNLALGKISGNDLNYDYDELRMERGINFESSLSEFSVVVEYDFFGNKRYRKKRFFKTFSPYAYLGLGLVDVEPFVDYNEGNMDNNPELLANINKDKTANFTNANNVVPVGVGVKYDLWENFILGAELGLRWPFTDYLDGVSEAGDPEDKDKYLIGGLTISYKFGKRDKDRDGVTDDKDACPKVAGPKRTRGCPDSDGDGVSDKRDQCPDLEGLRKLKGCPDADNDGIADDDDACPYAKGEENMAGCPDTDKDGIKDSDDVCPEVAGLVELEGCPDTDKDGVTDAKDDCPEHFGSPLNNGCPNEDSDSDGILDIEDDCPQLIGIAQFNGCPDRDMDGVKDMDDKCPDTPGALDNFGCPIIEETKKEILQFAQQAVQFESNSSILTAASLDVLKRIFDLMEEFPDYKLRIRGYTDSKGNDSVNQQLSESRARNCVRYFLAQGVSGRRLKAQGYGETSAIADNNTTKGRKLNRRVEFEMVIDF